MNIIIYKPTSASRRFRTVINKKKLWNTKSIKFLTIGLKHSGGRNNQGKITVRHIGGGNKKLYRKIDFKRSLIKTSAYVIRIEYDPNRNSYIALICYSSGILSYIIAPEGLSVGTKIITDLIPSDSIGNCISLYNTLIGSIIHNIELIPGNGAVLCRAAGSYALLIDKTSDNYGIVKLSSGEIRKIALNCMITIGMVSNFNYKNTILGKAGASRWLGIRPTVRGVAMNPIDHPHGGGEGRTSGGRPSVSLWGYPTKAGFKKKKKYNRFIISKRNV